MSVIFLVLPLALVFSGLALLAFLWAVRKGQFDDLDTPALRILPEERLQPALIRVKPQRPRRRR